MLTEDSCLFTNYKDGRVNSTLRTSYGIIYPKTLEIQMGATANLGLRPSCSPDSFVCLRGRRSAIADWQSAAALLARMADVYAWCLVLLWSLKLGAWSFRTRHGSWFTGEGDKIRATSWLCRNSILRKWHFVIRMNPPASRVNDGRSYEDQHVHVRRLSVHCLK